jgi:hypothetical protein
MNADQAFSGEEEKILKISVNPRPKNFRERRKFVGLTT